MGYKHITGCLTCCTYCKTLHIENVNEEILDFWRDVIYNTTESV